MEEEEEQVRGLFVVVLFNASVWVCACVVP
jgi:hypothetical protein